MDHAHTAGTAVAGERASCPNGEANRPGPDVSSASRPDRPPANRDDVIRTQPGPRRRAPYRFLFDGVSVCPSPSDAHHRATATTHTRGAAAASDGPMLSTPAEAAQRLQIRESWLRKQAAARQVPCTFLGEHLRLSTADLAAIIAAAARAPVGRKPRRRPLSGVRDDLPAAPPRSVHAHRDDHQPEGSSPWPG